MRFVLAAFALAVLAGCTSSSGGSHEASLTFDGAGNGAHNDVASCNSDATVLGTGEVSEGRVELRAYDGDGTQVFSRDFTGGVNVASEHIHGASGGWRITAARSPDSLLGNEFRGHYEFSLAC